MITYLPDDPHPGGKFIVSYSSLREDYLRYTLMSDEDFLANLLDILHFACIVCWVKEKQTQWLLGDTGLIHELVHLLIEQKEQAEITTTPLSTIRDIFNRDCCLA